MNYEELAKVIENYPEEMADGSLFADLLRPVFWETDEEAHARRKACSAADTPIRGYCIHVLRLYGLGMEAAQARHPHAAKVLDLVREPLRMIRIHMLASAVRENRRFTNESDPLFFAAIRASQIRQCWTHPKDIVFWHQLQEKDYNESTARFTGALAKVINNKNGDEMTYYRLYSSLFFRVHNGRWPTLDEIEKTAGDNVPNLSFNPGCNTWLRFRKKHRLDWLEGDTKGRKKGATHSADVQKASGKKRSGK